MADASFVEETVLISGPACHVDLSALDARHPLHPSRRLLIFCCASPSQRNAQLVSHKAGQQALVSRFPILGGLVTSTPSKLSSNGKRDWRTIVQTSQPGIELQTRDLRKALTPFDELEKSNFPLSELRYDLFMPIPYDLSNDQSFAACRMQFNAIEGGTIITWTMSHSVTDGSGHNEMTRMLAKETRLSQGNSSDSMGLEENSAGLDRSPLAYCALDPESTVLFS